MPYRQQQSRLTLTVDGVNLGVWEDKTGGDTDSNSAQYNLGGMGPRISLGGSQQVNNVVVTKLQDADIQARIKWLRSRAGRGAAVVIDQPVDDEGTAWGEPEVFSGVLKRVKSSDRSASSNNAATVDAEIEINGSVG